MTKNLDVINMLVDKFGITHAKDSGRGDSDLLGMGGQGRGGGGGGQRRGMGDGGRRHGRRNVEGF